MFAPGASAPASRPPRPAAQIHPYQWDNPTQMRARAVMLDAAFEAVLATVLLLGVAFANIDERDFPSPASDGAIAVFALVLFVFAVVLGEIVKRDAVSDTVLTALAAVNAGTAVVLALWVLLADGFNATGRIVVWTTVGFLLLLAGTQ